jgi:hypothetical protein
VLRRLRTLTDTALKLDIEDDTKEGVRAARRELDMLLAAREKQKK